MHGLTISTWSSKHSGFTFFRDFEVFDSENNLVAIATSKWVLFDLNKNSIVKITPEIAENYPLVDRHVFKNPDIGKITTPENLESTIEYTVLNRDIDTNHHVNNLIYLDLAYEALPPTILANYDFKNVEIMYKHSAKLGDTLKFRF